MSEHPRHPGIPRSNSKIVPPYIPPPRKESLEAENDRLKADVERLTKAGDAMASIIKYHPELNTFDPVPDVVKRWNAAKEGKGQP